MNLSSSCIFAITLFPHQAPPAFSVRCKSCCSQVFLGEEGCPHLQVCRISPTAQSTQKAIAAGRKPVNRGIRCKMCSSQKLLNPRNWGQHRCFSTAANQQDLSANSQVQKKRPACFTDAEHRVHVLTVRCGSSRYLLFRKVSVKSFSTLFVSSGFPSKRLLRTSTV